jgi:hypothetical protein
MRRIVYDVSYEFPTVNASGKQLGRTDKWFSLRVAQHEPDSLLGLVERMSLMRLSLKKAAHADMSRAAHRKSGGVPGSVSKARQVPQGRLKILKNTKPT